jgi:hypothetical protein
MTELFFSRLCFSLAVSAVSFMFAAGTWYEIFIHRRNDLRTQSYMEAMIGRGIFFMRLGAFSLFLTIVACIMQWCW